jgi:hypothetical protein
MVAGPDPIKGKQTVWEMVVILISIAISWLVFKNWDQIKAFIVHLIR